MRAVRYDRFGPPDVLHVADVPERAPRAGELRVRVLAASLNPVDWKIRAGHVRFVPLFARPPRTTGCDFAGEIVGTGGGAGPRHVGERVFGSLSPFGRDGSCAEFLVVAAARVTPTPAALADDAAATLPIAGGTALQALADDAAVGPGRRVLITGAAGGVGHFAVQVAKHLGAHTVATCGPGNVEFVRTLGADEVVDYTLPDCLSRVGGGFDVVFDVAESIGWRRSRDLLVRHGLYLATGGSTASAVETSVAGVVAPFLAGVRARTFVLEGGPKMNERLAELAAAGVLKPHIARRVPLDEVAEAQRAMETGHGRGKIVVAPGLGDTP
jgi:NADPH:quinone reductase-like Zn-dependent oxidoreductase